MQTRTDTLQRYNTENSRQIFSEKELRGLSPNFHIHACVCDGFVYSHDRFAYSAAGKYVDRSSEHMYKSLTDA
jgi:hypothetical protein